MRFAVLTSYLHVCCYLVFSVASRHTLAMSHQSHRYSVVDLGVSSFSLRTLHPNSRATLLMYRFFVSDGVILRSVISLVWPGVRSLANSACLPTLMCRGVGSIPVCTAKAPFFFCTQNRAQIWKKNWFTTWQPGSLHPWKILWINGQCSRFCQEGCDTMTKMSRTGWAPATDRSSVLQVWTRGHETMDVELCITRVRKRGGGEVKLEIHDSIPPRLLYRNLVANLLPKGV